MHKLRLFSYQITKTWEGYCLGQQEVGMDQAARDTQYMIRTSLARNSTEKKTMNIKLSRVKGTPNLVVYENFQHIVVPQKPRFCLEQTLISNTSNSMDINNHKKHQWI